MIIKKTDFRIAQACELETIVDLQIRSFGNEAEGRLVRQLVGSTTTTHSILAEYRGEIIGHILLSEIEAPVKSLSLAPLAVLPTYRDMQIGSELVRQGLELAKQQHYQAVFVLGDTNYYERFGFSSPLADNFECPWQCRNFMVKELQEKALEGQSGTLTYPKPFSEMKY